LQGTAAGNYVMGVGTSNNLLMQYLVNSSSTLYQLGNATLNFTPSGSTASATFSGTLTTAGGTDTVFITNGSYSGGYNP
jgi:hypothetical protein